MKKKRFIAMLVLVIICSLFMESCKPSHQINPKLPPMAANGTITYGLYGLDGEIEVDKHFRLASHEQFEKIFAFGNFIDSDRDYKLLIFVDYQATMFSVNDQEFKQNYDFSAEAQEHIHFKFMLPPLEDGFHDLLLVVVKDPNNLSLDDEYRKQTDLSHLTSVRYSITVGENDGVKVSPDFLQYPSIENTVLEGIFLNDKGEKLQRLLTMECAFEDNPSMFIHIGNNNEQSRRYAVILLYDWNQISINEDNILYLLAEPNSQTTIPLLLDSVGERGVHNLTAICIEEPFQHVAIGTPRADFSIRIGVNVR